MSQHSHRSLLLDHCRQQWRRLLLLLLPVAIGYASLLALEGVAISRIDRWLPITTFESATWAALFVTAGLTFGRLCLIGFGVWLVLDRCMLANRRFAVFSWEWGVASALVAGALFAINLWQHYLQYSGGNYAGETVRSILLLTIYAKILLCYPGVRLLFGTVREHQGGLISWTAVSFVESLVLYFFLLVLKLFVESILVTVLSYLPFVAPFWFIPDELSRMRYFVGQGSRIAAESVGALFYIAFFVAIIRPSSGATSMSTSDGENPQ